MNARHQHRRDDGGGAAQRELARRGGVQGVGAAAGPADGGEGPPVRQGVQDQGPVFRDPFLRAPLYVGTRFLGRHCP